MADLLDKRAFQNRLQQIARDDQLPLDELQRQAIRYLDEMRGDRKGIAVWTFAKLSRFMYRRGYQSEIFFDTVELDKVRELATRRSVVFLVTHKTYLDFFVLFDFLHRQGIGPPFIFGGINIAFAGFGNLARHAGGIFIRRSFRDNAVYKAVLQHYIAFLIEEGHSFMWAIEGTRSRTGKLVLPKLGLLKYVVDASQGLGDDAIAYIPVCVAYDQIPDVIDMSAQEAGAIKKPESVSWFLKYIRKTAGHFGNIYVRFGDAVSLYQTLHAPNLTRSHILADERTIEIKKLAFEVCYRINEITPATESSLALMSLLCRARASAAQIHADVRTLQNYIRIRQSSALFDSPNEKLPNQLDETLTALVQNGIVHAIGKQDAAVYSIVAERYLVALYYSNMAAHHFVIAAFTELALVGMSKNPSVPGDTHFEIEIMNLRNLFKFEFFFARKDRFQQQFIEEFRYLGSSLATVPGQGSDAARALLSKQPLLVAESVLRPYVNAYQVVADFLLQDPANAKMDPVTFVGECQAHNREAGLHSVHGHPHVAPRALLATGHSLAGNRGLLELGSDVVTKRQRFAEELSAVSDHLTEIRKMTV